VPQRRDVLPRSSGTVRDQVTTMYLPGAAANALTRVAQTDRDYLQPWQGAVVLAGYGLAFAAAGTLLSMRRDVT
jgi:hypothetical protein